MLNIVQMYLIPYILSVNPKLIMIFSQCSSTCDSRLLSLLSVCNCACVDKSVFFLSAVCRIKHRVRVRIRVQPSRRAGESTPLYSTSIPLTHRRLSFIFLIFCEPRLVYLGSLLGGCLDRGAQLQRICGARSRLVRTNWRAGHWETRTSCQPCHLICTHCAGDGTKLAR